MPALCEESPTVGEKSMKKDWRQTTIQYLHKPDSTRDKKIRRQAMKYVMQDGELHSRTMDGLLLKCLDEEGACVAMGEVHEGLCGTHQSVYKMKWMLQRAGLYWPIVMEDCIRYRRGYEACEKFGDVQTVLVSMLHPIIRQSFFVQGA
jgi:hypothetical protein